MDTQHKKSILLSTLQQQEEPISLPDLLEILGSGFSERSVRRWLSEMAGDNLIEKTGQKRSTRYFALPQASGHGLFGPDSKKSIAYVRKPIFERRPVAYNKKWVDGYQPNRTYYLSNEKRRLLHSEGQRNTNHNQAGTYARKIYNRLLIDLSYNSSRLEGNTYSLIQTEKLIIEGVDAKGKLDEEKVMILNHKEAIRHLIKSIQKIQINTDEICTLHYLLSDALIPAQYSGKLRGHAVRISSSTYIALEGLGQLQKQLQIICKKATEIIDPFEQSFFLLTHIAYLQAFADVNKRTSRLSANIPLIQANLVPLSFNDIDKDDYASAMIAIYELNDIQPLTDLYHFSYIRTCHEYDATIESINFDEVRIRFRQQLRDTVRCIIVKSLIGKQLERHIEEQTNKLIPEEHWQQFKKNVEDDLDSLGPERIAGLGVTQVQLKNWLKLNKANK